MDGRGRLAEALTGALARPAEGAGPAAQLMRTTQRVARRWAMRLSQFPLPRGAGVIGLVLFMTGAIGYATMLGGHAAAVGAELRGARDAIANGLGFRITSIALAGRTQLTREEILTTAGVTGRSSLLFLDASEARTRLKTNPWIAEATILKLYPGRLHISITEREAFALWQKDGKVSVIAQDGTVLEQFVSARFAKLPLMVGAGAEVKAKNFLAILDRYPAFRQQLKAAVLVADRRWNLVLQNGIDVRLPEHHVEAALDTLSRLDEEKKLLSRDIEMVDLRLADRVTVRLSEAAFAARNEMLKPVKPKRKGGDA